MKRIYALIISIILASIYLFGVNIIAEFKLTSNGNGGVQQQIQGGGTVYVGMSDSVSVQVFRDRWYGDIYEEPGKISNLYLFNLIKLPIKVKEKSWVLYHWVFFILMTIFVIFQRTERRYYVT